MSALVLEPATVWTAAGVLLSVQSAATAWRAAAKSEEPPQHPRDPLWLPCAEMLNLFSIAVCVVGVFVVPLLAQSRQAAESGFCVYVLLHGGVPLAYLGHYEAFAARDRTGAYCPPQSTAPVALDGADERLPPRAAATATGGIASVGAPRPRAARHASAGRRHARQALRLLCCRRYREACRTRTAPTPRASE